MRRTSFAIACAALVVSTSGNESFLTAQLKPCTNCSGTSVGFIPLNDLGTESYQGKQGGLYPGGKNVRPSFHESAGIRIAKSISPLNSAGAKDDNGRYVLLSIGMSNTNQEFTAFKSMADVDPDKDKKLVIVNGAQGGWPANEIVNPNALYWLRLDSRLTESGVSAKQVAVVWLKQADSRPSLSFPQDAEKLQSELRTIVQILKQKFPKLKMAYLSSRIYGGYASTTLNPEPFAYQSAFAVKWLIRDQINGGVALIYDSNQGTVKAPWLSWGPYLWSDGTISRSDGLIWKCSDFRCDGTHPSEFGRRKVARILMDFFKTDTTAREWYLATP